MASTSAPSFTRTGNEPVASVRSLRKSYPRGIVALEDVNLELAPASVTALTGPNGSGKTTLLRILAGRLAPTSGTAVVLGVDPVINSRWLRSRVGFISQDVALDPEMTGAHTLRLFAILYGVPGREIAAKIDQLAQSLQLTRHLALRVHAYSGGLRRRLHLALGLLHDPQLLLLDEPSAGLDPEGRAFLWALLEGLAGRSVSIAVITHDLAEVERHCHRVAVFAGGKLLAFGSPKSVVQEHARRMLKVSFARGSELPEAALAELAKLPGVQASRLKGSELSIEVLDERLAKDRILSMLSSKQLEVRGFHIQEPDLASAYFRITGSTPDEPPGPAEGRRAGARAWDREAAS